MPSVADLVEPGLLRERAGEYLQRAGEVLLAASGVHVMHLSPTRVTAEVDDGDDRHEVELAATGDGVDDPLRLSEWRPGAVVPAHGRDRDRDVAAGPGHASVTESIQAASDPARPLAEGSAADDAGLDLGRRFVDAVVARDWVALRACLAPAVEFRAVVPNEQKPFRDWAGPEDTVAQLRRWFDDSDVFELERRDVEQVADKTHVTYRFHGHEPDGWYRLEQQAYLLVDHGQVTRIDLVCSGFREVPPP